MPWSPPSLLDPIVSSHSHGPRAAPSSRSHTQGPSPTPLSLAYLHPQSPTDSPSSWLGSPTTSEPSCSSKFSWSALLLQSSFFRSLLPFRTWTFLLLFFLYLPIDPGMKAICYFPYTLSFQLFLGRHLPWQEEKILHMLGSALTAFWRWKDLGKEDRRQSYQLQDKPSAHIQGE